MTTKSWLRKRAEEAAEWFVQCGTEWRTIAKGGRPCTQCSSRVSDIADAIESVAKEFAERAILNMYDVDDNDQTSSDGERARGGFRIKSEVNPKPNTEWRYYRADFRALVAGIVAAAERGDE